MPSSLRWMRISTSVMAVAVLVLAFQNCTSKARFSSQHSSEAAQSTNQNAEGGTYDGKPRAGEYLRHYPQGCSESSDSNLIGILQVDSSQAQLDRDICTSMKYSLDFADSRLEYSSYNRDYLGLNGAIFEHQDVSSRGSMVDLWCRHQEANGFALDFVVKSEAGISRGILYSASALGTSSPQIRPKEVFNVSKSASAQSISISSSRIQASVDLSAANNFKYPGRMSLNLDGQNLNLAAECRVLSPAPALYQSPAQVLALYQFNSGKTDNGALVADSSANGLNGSLSNSDQAGAQYETAPMGNALHLDGRNDYVNISGLAQRVSTEFTISIWVKADLTIADDRVMFAINTAAGDNVLKLGSGMCTGLQDRTSLSLEVGDTCFDTGRLLVDGNYHLVTMSVGAGTVRVSFDGQPATSQAFALPLQSSDVWSLGMDLDAASVGDFWKGWIDEAIIWNRAL